MSCRAHRFAFAVILMLTPALAGAQGTFQPTAAPAITAESAAWFQAGEPVAWNNDVYYPAGTPQPFNGYHMVRSGSYQGIPLYTDTMLEPNSIVFLPIAGGRMQPYERRRAGVLAGTTGSLAPTLPTTIATEPVGSTGNLMQAAGPPTNAPAYDAALIPPPVAPAGSVASAAPPAPVSMMTVEPAPRVSPPAETSAVGTAGRLTMAPAVAPARPVTTVVPPTGLNAIWINFDGQRWYAASRSMAYDASVLEEIGTYRGFTVYRRNGDPAVIYIPSAPGRLSAYTKRAGF